MKSVTEEAARWFARVAHTPPDHPDRGRFEAWLAANPIHAAEYAAFAGVWEDFDSAARLDALAKAAARRKAALQQRVDEQRDARRRLIKRGVLGLVMCGGAGTLAWRGFSLWNSQPLQQLALSTRTAETAKQVLPEGSTLRLNARTALSVTYFRNRREVRLDRGEAIFEVTHDATRPFIVDSGLAHIVVLGTRFAVTRLEDRVRVSVSSGRVLVNTPSAEPSDGLTLGAGEVAEITAALPPLRVPRSAADAFAWERGMLVFDAAPLAEIAESLSRYRARPVRAQAAGPRITAVVQISDIEGFLRILPVIAAVRVENNAHETRIVAR